ncbi:MAG TPA: BTAD domain-containing putative transcriptional regulator [Streptomyces sp.]|uniref:AfsR/SARP family transcriptional regulator n=1 Tax=Streptomyces sp. TaxID=1931 RepID=UPI002D361948|nr:BTAD domain-containing putative transcriptional regulator [Streptomyces sp.]HZG06081.1 BTAD domain-containing putative transcriptional regulator [Streptomyces sp.]
MNGELRTPSAPMARRVLALLLTHADRVVPTELLIDELWSEQPPRRARKTVQTYIYQLRKTLSGDENAGQSQELVETHPHGYRLPLQDCHLDVKDFQALVREGREALARGRANEGAVALRRALDLWRGAPLEDVETGPVLAAQAARLEDLRIHALEQRIAADLALGAHQSLLEEIRDLTYQHPLHEEFCAQLMMAAKRCGQRGEALSAYARLRRAMAEQLGLEPSVRLQELQNRILAGQDERFPAPSRADGSGALFQLPPAIGDFVGRRDVLDRIEYAVREARPAPEVRIVTVTGGPGVGKTQVALQVAHRLRKHFPDGQLKADMHLEDGTAQHPAEALRGLLVAVGYDRRCLPERTDDLARIFRGWAADRRFLLLLDDAAGRDQILPLLPAGADNTVIVTSRCRMAGLPGAVTSVDVGPMSEDEGSRLLAQVVGEERTAQEPDAAAAIAARCEGMPTAIRAIGSRIAAWPGRSLADFAARLADERRRLEELSSPDLDVRRYLVESADRLPSGAREVLTEVSRAGRTDVTVAHLARTLCRSVPSVERSVELLAAFHLLKPVVRNGSHVLRVSPLLRLAFAHGEHTRAPVPVMRDVAIGGMCPVAAQVCPLPGRTGIARSGGQDRGRPVPYRAERHPVVSIPPVLISCPGRQADD